MLTASDYNEKGDVDGKDDSGGSDGDDDAFVMMHSFGFWSQEDFMFFNRLPTHSMTHLASQLHSISVHQDVFRLESKKNGKQLVLDGLHVNIARRRRAPVLESRLHPEAIAHVAQDMCH